MTRIPAPLHLDPFFDGEGGDVAPAAIPREGNTGARSPTPSGAGGYQAVEDSTLSDGRPMSHVMRSGTQGLRGTVIPHASQGGVPAGTRPHDLANLEVNIDPHIEGQSVVVRLGDVTSETLARANEMADQVTDAGAAFTVEQQRLRGAAVMHGIAAQHQEVQEHTLPMATMPQAPGNIPAPNLGHVAGPQPARVTSPLRAFTERPDTIQGREPRAIDLSQSPTVEHAITAPKVEVTFEIEQFGVHTAHYHEVLVEGGFIVLIYNSAYQHGNRYFPTAGPTSPPMALNIAGRPEVYLVETTGFHYAYNGLEFCILLINKTAVDEPEQGESLIA